MPAFSEEELDAIMERAIIAYPTMTRQRLEGLNQAYDYAVYEKNMPAFELGVGASTGWGKTFEYMVELSGLPRAQVSAYLVAMREFMDGTIPKDSWLERMGEGVEAILSAPADAVNMALDPLLRDGTAVKTGLKYGAVIVGGLAVLYLGGKMFKPSRAAA